MSLKCMIDKWLHKGQISQEEYNAVMKKLDGHNKQIRADAIEKFRKFSYCKVCEEKGWNIYCDYCRVCQAQEYIAEQLKESKSK